MQNFVKILIFFVIVLGCQKIDSNNVKRMKTNYFLDFFAKKIEF